MGGQNISEVIIGAGTLSIKYPVGGSYVDVGFTDDGVVFEYTAETSDYRAEETTFPIGRVINTEDGKFTLTLAQASLDNLNKAMAGGSLAGSVLSLGTGAIKQMSVKLVGKNPAGFSRTIEMALCTASGAMAMPMRKASPSKVPITLVALDNGSAEPVVITDATS